MKCVWIDWKKIKHIFSYIFCYVFTVYSSLDKKSKPLGNELSKEEFLEFKSIILFYIDFCQKQKVMDCYNDNTYNNSLSINIL